MPKPSCPSPVHPVILSIACLVLFLLGLCGPVNAGEPCDETATNAVFLDLIPKRPRGAITGTQFARKTDGMKGVERQAAAVQELLSGNIPGFLRNLKPIFLSHGTHDGEDINALIWVTPDYLSIGSNEDFLRIPLTYPSAVTVAGAFGCILPTQKIVDAVYLQSTCHLKPAPLPPCRKMRSSEYYLKHQKMILHKRKIAG